MSATSDFHGTFCAGCFSLHSCGFSFVLFVLQILSLLLPDLQQITHTELRKAKEETEREREREARRMESGQIVTLNLSSFKTGELIS